MPSHTLLLIDAGLADLDILMSGLNPGVVPFVVQPDQDALEVLEAALATASTFDTLALVAHGKPGEVLIGREPITTTSLSNRRAAWALLASHKFDSIHLFACHAGQDQAFVDGLGAITGCAVAAADTTIGHDSLGAVWQLDVSSSPRFGSLQANAANGLVPFSRAAQASWLHALTTYYVGTPTSGNGDGSSGNPWNQAGFDAVSGSSAGNTLSIASGFTLTTTASKIAGGTVTGAGSLVLTGYTNEDIHLVNPGGTLSVTTAAGASLTSANLPMLVDSLVLGGAATADANIFSTDTTLAGQLGVRGASLDVNGKTLTLQDWTGQRIDQMKNTSAATINVTAANGFTGGTGRLGDIDSLTIPAGASGALTGTFPHLAANGFVINGALRTISPADVSTMAAYINGTGTLTLAGYTTEDLSGLPNSLTVSVTTSTGAVLDSTKLAPVDSITIGAGTASGTAAAIDTLGDAKITVASGATLAISGYTTQTLGGMTNNGTIDVTTANGAVLDATNLADATTITLGTGTTASSTAMAIDALGPSSITVTGATLNISDTAANLAASSTAALTLGTSVAVTGTTAAAADLNTTNGKISVALDAASVTTLTGAATDVKAAYSANTAGSISGLGNESVTLSGSTTVADANSVDGSTTGVITATITEGTLSSLTTLTGTGNAYTITVSDTSAAATDLTSVDGKTTVALNAAAVLTLTGAAADVNTVYTAGTVGTIAGLGNEAVTLNDTTLAATVLNTVNSNTTGVVNAASVATLSGLLSDVNTAYAANSANTISGLGDEAVTITNGAGTLLASDLSTAGNATTGTVTVTNAQTVSGTVAEVTAALVTASSKVVMGSASTATVSNAATAAEGAPIATTSNITAAFSSGISDTLANLASSGTISSNLSNITADQGNVVVTISDSAGGTVQAADLSAVGNATTGTVTVSNAQTVTGTQSQVTAALVTAATKVVMGSASTATVSNSTSAAGGALIANTTNVTASFPLGINDTLANFVSGGSATANLSSITTDQPDVVLRITDAGGGTMSAADLSAVGNASTGTVVVSNGQTVSGTTAEVTAALVTSATKVVMASASNATVTDAATAATGAAIAASSNVTASFSAGITDSLANLASGGAATANLTSISADQPAVVLTINNAGGGTMTAADLSAVGNATTGTVTVSNAQTVSGTTAEVTAALVTSATKVVMGSASTATVSNAATAAEGAPIATTTYITASFSSGISDTLANLASSGTISLNLSSITADQGSVVVTIADAAGGTVQAADLIAVGNATTGAVGVTNSQTVNGTAAQVIAAVVTSASKVDLNTASTLNASTYTTEDLSGVSAAFTLNVTTATGAVLDATKLATADSVTLVGTNSASAANAETLGSRLGGTATLNITTDPITANTNLSSLGSGLTLQFGGDSALVVTGATLTVRQNQVSGYAISGTGTVSAAGTAGADTFNASGITANTNFTSLAGADTITIAPSALDSVDVISGGADTDTLSFLAAGTVVDVAFTNVSSVEILQLAAGTNSITLGAKAELAGITTVTGDTGADTLNLLYGTTGLTFNAGTGSDTLSYSADSTTQSITLSSISSGTASGSVVNNGTDSFTGLEAIVGGSGTSDSLTSTSAAEALIVTGANAGTIDGFAFSGVESVDLGAGNDTGTINTGGSLSGSLTFGSGTDTLSYASYGSAVSATLSGSNTLTAVTAITGGVTGVENLTLSSNNDTLTVGGSGSLSGNLDFGAGSGDTLSYAGNANAVTVSLNTATSTASAGATGITGTTSGFETLIGGSGTTDTLNATNGSNTLSVASGGITTLDSLTVSAFETINFGANADASADTATISGAFSGTIDLGDGGDTATINSGGSVTSLVGGAGTDILNLDGADQTITVTATGNGTTSVSSGTATTFSGFETVNGLAGTDAFTVNSASTSTITLDGGNGTDSLSVASADTGANSLTISGAGSGTLGNVTFSGIESIALGSGGDTASVTTGSLSGNLNLGDGSNSLTISGASSSIGSYTGGTGADSVTLSGGGVGGNVDLGTGSNTLLISSTTSTVGGAVSFGNGSADTLSYAGYGNAVTVSLNSATSTAAAGATGITGAVTGFESLVGGSGSDTLNANAGVNSLNVAADGTTTLDTSLTVSGFETINLGASNDTATISGAFSGTVDLGVGNNTATINNGGSVTSLVGGSGTDTLNLDGANNSITVTGTAAGTTAGTSGGTTTFSGFETVNGLAGTDAFTVNSASTSTITLDGGSGTDLLSVAGSDTAANSLTISGAGSGTLGNVTFAGMESITLGSGNDTASVSSGGSLSGNLDLGAGTNSLSLASGAGSLGSLSAGSGNDTVTISGGTVSGAVSVGDGSNSLTISGTSSTIGSYTGGTGDDSVTLSGGDVTGNVDLGTGSNTLLISSTSSTIGGAVSFGSGTSDSLSYAGYGSAVSVTLSGIASNAGTTTSSGATAITGIVSGFESLTGSSNSDSLVGSSADNTLILTGANQGTVDGLSFSSFESVDLGGGNDSAQFTSGDSLSGTLAGGSGNDTLDYSAYGSGVTVNLATNTATGTGGISGFETVLGSATTDTLTASTSGDVNLQGNAGDDTVNVTVAGLTSTDTVDGGAGSDTLVFTDAGVITDSQLTNVTTVETVTLTGASTISAGTEASQAGIATINTGTGATTVNSTATGYDLTVNAANLADNANLTLSGSANTNDFTVTNLTGSVLAGNTSGTLAVTTSDATDNAIGVTTGSGATTITASASSDTVTTDASKLGQNTLLSFFGAAKQVVTNLVGNLTGANLTGTLNVSTADAGDEAISITTGNAATTIAGAAASDTISTDATALANNTTLTLSGSSNEVVTGLVGDISATALAGSLTVTTADNTADNGISITTGTANTTITASGSSDTLTVNADGMVDNTTLDLNGSATYTVSYLEADTNAADTTGTVNLAYTDVTGNAATITTGTSTTTVSGTTSGDKLTIDASKLANNTTLTESGAAQQVVTGLVGDINASALTGTLTVTTGDNTNDNGISIVTGSAATTITGSAATDTISTNAATLTENTTLTLAGSSNEVVTNLVGDISATALTGTLTVTTGTPSDQSLNITTGSANTTITGNSVGNALNLDGVNDYVTIPKSVTDDFTIEYWVKSTQTSSTGTQWYSGSGIVDAERPGGTSDFGTSLLNNKLAFGVGGSSDVTIQSQSSINTGSWNHIAVTRSNSSGAMQIYVNGTLEASGTGPTGSRTAPPDIAIGAIEAGGNYFGGTIDDLRIWNTVRSQADIQAYMNSEVVPQTGLVAYYNFNEGTAGGANSGTTSLVDNSGNGNTGTLNNFSLSGASSNWVTGAVSSPSAVVVNADQMVDNTTLDLNGTNTFTVTNLEANTDAADSTGSLTLTYSNVTDNKASLVTGTGNVVVNGGDATDTITVTGLSTNNQIFNAQASTSNFNITAGANNQTITGSNTGSDTINGGSGADTLSYAGGSNVNVTISSYATQAGGSTGQGTDSFSGIESLVGATGNDTLRGTTAPTDEVVTVTSGNTGTIRDSASTGTFSFSSFEQLDLQGGNDTLTINGNTSGVSLAGSVDLGSGDNSLTMNGSAGSIASLSSGTGNDTVTISAGSITGALSASDGTNQLTISGTSSSVGSYSGGSGVDTVTLSGGDIGGALSSGDGNDTVLISSTSSSIGGNLDLGAGTGDTLSYAGYGNTVSVTLTDITTNTGSTAAAGATAITGTATGFETLVGGSTSGDTLTDSTGDSTIAVTGANSGTIDGLAFSSIENLNLSTGNDTVTVTGSGGGVSLTGSLDLGDGTNSLTMSNSAGSIASVTSGTGDDTFSISAGSVTGALTAGDGNNTLTISGTSSSIGSYAGGNGTDSITLSGGDVVGNVSTTTGNDTLLISSTSSTIGGNLDLGGGTGDTLSYAGYTNAVSVTLTDITSNAGSTAAGGATAISGTATGFENLIGGSTSGDTVTDSTGDSTIVISGANSGTIDGMTFSAIENLSLSTGIDGVTVTKGASLSGNLNLGDGTSNTLTMDSGAGAIGSVTAAGGNDTVTINGGTITGAVNLGDGANALTINDTNSTIGSYTGGSGIDTIVSKGGDILGAVSTGSAADSVTLSLGATITGAVTLGANSDSADGNDSLSLNASSITGAVNTGSAADTVTLSSASTITGDVTLGANSDASDGIDTLTLDASSVTGNVSSGAGADAVSVLNTSTITGNVTLGTNTDSTDGADTLTVTGASGSSKSVITGSISTGAGADTLTLTNATIGGVGQTLSLGSDNNGLDGNDSLSGSGTAITGNITTGSGSDTLTLSTGSSVTGNVSLGIDGDTPAITDSFDSLSGWSGGALDSSSSYYGSFLGRYANGSKTNGQDVSKSFTLNSQPATISFDFLRLDSWDAENFTAYINNTAAFTGNFRFDQAIISASGTTNGFSWTIAAKDSYANHGFSGWQDQTATITITLPSGYSNIKLGFGSDLNSDSSDESYGIDNLSIIQSNVSSADTLTLTASTITGDVTTGSGADAVSVLSGSKITGSVNLGSDSDTKDAADTLTVTGVPSGTKSEVTGSITAGAGADTLTFTNATIGGAGQTISLGSDNNSNDGNDSLTANGTAITATITTGSGSDTVILNTASSLTGDVTLGVATDTTNGNTDTLTLNASNVTGNVSTGSGTDAVSVLTTSTIIGNVTLGSDVSQDGADSLTVTGSSSASKSVITGSIATGAGADTVTLTNATIGGAGQTLSLGSDSSSLDGNDTLTANGTAITATITGGSGADTVNLSVSSTVLGDVTLGMVGDAYDGADTLTLNASNVTGNVSTGAGADALSVINTSTITGSVTLGSNSDSVDGADSLTVTGASSASKSVITGSIATGAGADTLTLTNATIGGAGQTISLGSDNNGLDGNDSLTANGTAITATITTGSGSDSVTINSASTVKGDVTLGIAGDTTIGSIDTLTLDASSITGNVGTGSGADTLTLTNASTITGNVTLGSNTDSADGGDTLTVTGASSSSTSVITGSIATGSGADTLTLTNATIGGVGQTMSLGSDTNGLDGNDSLSASGTAITGNITTGSGSDLVSLSAGSSVTGDVSLGSVGDNQAIIDYANTVSDSFNTASGWTNGTVDSTNSYYGSFLGRYAFGTRSAGQDVYKTFSLNSQPATISLDFIKLDSWDGESFKVYIDDTAAFSGNFSLGQSINSSSGSTNGFTWTINPKDSMVNHGFQSGWSDQTATISITLPSGYTNFHKLGFGSTLDQDISDESYGIDNLTIIPTIVSHDDTLTLDASTIIGNVSTGSAADTVTLSNNSTITGTVTLGSNTDAYDGNDSLTLKSGSKIAGNVDLGAANDTLTLSTGISSATTITGDVAFGVGNGDTISYSGNAGPITVALDGISADAVGTATGAKASYVTGNVTGFETIVGSDYSAPTSSSVTGDTIYDNTGASLVILTGANAGTIDNLDFSSIENLQLRSGADTLSFQGTSGAPGLIAGRADGGGIEGASYTNGVYSGGTKTDTSIDLLDYTAYNAGGVSVDLSQNKATGVYGGLAGGLISGDGSIATTTTDSSFENVDGSSFNDTIIGDNQSTDGNVLRGFDGADSISGLAGNDVLDGGNGVGSNITDGADTIQGGLGSDTIIGSFGNDSISGGTFGTASDASIDTLTYSATAISSARIEGLDISLVGTDTGTVLGDANASLSVSTFTNTYNSSISQQLITAPTNQVSNDWKQSYTDIQNLVLSEQSDILRLDPTDVNTGSIDAKGGSLDTLDYSTFDAASPVLVNLSSAAYSFDFDNNGKIDTTIGEITITNGNSATNVMVGEASSQGGANGVFGFEVVLGGAADDAIVGNADANLLVGNAGDDRIAGGAGNDTIYGGTGDDYIVPGDGADYVNAGAGINTIAITSSDLAQDTFNVDPNGINIFALQGNGGNNTSSIDAPSGYWNPGAQGIDLLDGGDPVVSGGVTIYDTINGTSNADTYEFGGVAFKNIGSVDLGAGNDSVGTAATTKGIKVNYDGNTGTDSITLNLTFGQFAKLNASGLYVADVQNYLDNPNGKTFSSSQADFTANNFETGGVAVITPGVFNALQGDPAATTFNTAYGARNSTITSGNDVNLSASALTTSTATATSVPDIVSAFVQASGVKGSDAISVTSGGSTSGSTTASQDASALSRTVDDRADSVLSAYGLGTDRSSFTAGQDITLSLSGNVKADTSAESVGFVVNASGTAEAAGSRDSSLTAGDALKLSISGTAAQTVGASNVAGLALAALASRTYGIDDANLTDSTADSVQAGSDLSLQATASSSNRVTAQTVGTDSLGTLSLVDNGTAASDRFTTTQIGADFPLINGDRVRFTTANGSVQADRDYYVLNVIPITGEFQLSSEPNGDPIDVVAAGSLQAYRPAVATADAISTVTGVDLNRTVVNGSGVQAGDSLSLRASATDALAASATSVAGDATAGVFRLGGMDGLNLASEVSSIQALADTISLAGSGASLNLNATDTATLKAASTEGAALTEANIQVFGSKSSASTAGDDLSLSTQADLTLSGSASSTAGSAESRSGAGAGAGVTTPLAVGSGSNVLPSSSSYSVVTGLADGTQTAGADLTVQAKGATSLNATANTVSGADTLGSLWTSATGNILATFNLNLNTTTNTPSFVGPQYLAAGQLVQLDTASATATGLAANTDYAVKLLGFGAVDSTADTLTMPTGITYAVNDAVRFRLNSTTAPNSSESRYGLALGSTYYVKSVTGTAFTLSASPGGPVIDLSADSLGPADQLVDADRFQLLTLPTAPGGTYAVAPVTASASGVSLSLPSVANAFAGSREVDRTLNSSDSINLAQVSGISGNAGLRGLVAGAQSAITALANGVLNAVARNTGNDATASAGLVAEGISDTAITAGSAGTVKADASITGVADAATTGNNALIDNSLADLTITARGLTASNAANDITIGGVGDVQATATLAGRSTASTVQGNSDALADLKATGLESLSSDITISMGQQGNLSGTAGIGSAASPLLVEAFSAAVGNATAQTGLEGTGILGSVDGLGLSFSTISQGGGNTSAITGLSSANLDLRSIATAGNSTTSLVNTNGALTADISGIRDTSVTIGSSMGRIAGSAISQESLQAITVSGNATSYAATTTSGILSDKASAIVFNLSDNAEIAVLANQKSVSSSVSVLGQATSDISNSSIGLNNLVLTVAGDSRVRAEALSDQLSKAQSSSGNASA